MDYMKMPITMNFELTYSCNAKCKFCSIKNNIQSNFVDITKIKDLIDIFDQNEIMRLNLFGGEPFIYPQIDEVVRYAKSKGMFISGVSNGIAIDETLCRKINGCVDVLGISVHGIGTEHDEFMGCEGCFSKALNAIELLCSSDIPVGINITVTALNYNKIIEIVKFIKSKYNIQFVALNRFIVNKSLPAEVNKGLAVTVDMLESTLVDLKHLKETYPDMNCEYAIHFPFCVIKDKELRKYIGAGCGIGQNYCSVNYNGDMKMCSYSDFILGNVFEEPMKQIWENHSMLKLYRNEDWLPAECRTCKEIYCKGGCKMAAGKLYSIDPLFKERVRI
ncbi:MAG: radical SAM protein [Clostridia bacterium]|nr:radical SAM protein [Clostridia bacterium]